MLPSSKNSLIDGGFSPKQASWILIICFLGGVFGIQFLSRIMHHFMPSHVVDCEHTHEDKAEMGHDHEHGHPHEHEESRPTPAPRPQTPRSSLPGHMMSPSGGRRHASRQTSYFTYGGPTSTFAPTAESESQNDHLTVTQTEPVSSAQETFVPISCYEHYYTAGFRQEGIVRL